MSRRYQGGFLTVSYNGLKVPDAPTIGTATNGNAQASVTFTAPTNVGGGAITSYQAIATKVSDGTKVLATGTSSPIVVTGLTNGSTYNIAVAAINSYGAGPASATTTANPYLPNPPTSVEYLVVAGGGGGGTGGGGGAGGFLTGTTSVTAGVANSITVGAGGAGGYGVMYGGKTGYIVYAAVSGSASYFAAVGASGGGRGGYGGYYNSGGTTAGNAANFNGAAGGSGGGSGYYTSYYYYPGGKSPGYTVIVNTGGAGTSGQGYAGGDTSNTFGNRQYLGGGGGGAGGAGGISNSSTPYHPGNGGSGVSSSITGSSVTYAGGGGGGCGYATPYTTAYDTLVTQANQGTGGSGGGGYGAYYIPAYNIGKTTYPIQYIGGTAGTANLGGGGGGGSQGYMLYTLNRSGGAGGSGVVVIRYPDTYDAPIATTGSPTVTVSGGYRIYKYTGSGTITF